MQRKSSAHNTTAEPACRVPQNRRSTDTSCGLPPITLRDSYVLAEMVTSGQLTAPPPTDRRGKDKLVRNSQRKIDETLRIRPAQQSAERQEG
jgi:hypothetical protein